jgi:hypothetical protein
MELIADWPTAVVIIAVIVALLIVYVRERADHQ